MDYAGQYGDFWWGSLFLPWLITSSYRGSTSADLTYVDLSCLSSSNLSRTCNSLSRIGLSCAVKGALSIGESAMVLLKALGFGICLARVKEVTLI
jgi:hypothetical protein